MDKLRMATLTHFTMQWPRRTTGRLEKVQANFYFIVNSIKANLFHLARWQIADDQ